MRTSTFSSEAIQLCTSPARTKLIFLTRFLVMLDEPFLTELETEGLTFSLAVVPAWLPTAVPDTVTGESCGYVDAADH